MSYPNPPYGGRHLGPPAAGRAACRWTLTVRAIRPYKAISLGQRGLPPLQSLAPFHGGSKTDRHGGIKEPPHPDSSSKSDDSEDHSQGRIP